jgi:CRP-like cAMP-binding protein
VEQSNRPAVRSTVEDIEAVLRVTPVFRALAPADRRRVAEAATIRHYRKGERIFEQEAPADAFYTIATGRVKIFRMLPTGKDLILEVFGPGDPLGALAVYNDRPFPASASALEDAVCVVIPRLAFFTLLEQYPSLVRGLLLGMTTRLVELTNRIADLSAGRIEPRVARLFLKLARDMGRPDRGGIFVPLTLSRQEVADMVGTTIETCIRIMSKWGKQDIVRTEKDGFVIPVLDALEAVAEE